MECEYRKFKEMCVRICEYVLTCSGGMDWIKTGSQNRGSGAVPWLCSIIPSFLLSFHPCIHSSSPSLLLPLISSTPLSFNSLCNILYTLILLLPCFLPCFLSSPLPTSPTLSSSILTFARSTPWLAAQQCPPTHSTHWENTQIIIIIKTK